MEAPLASVLPNLFQTVTWGPVRATFELREPPPPETSIGNVNLVPYVGDHWVVIGLQSGKWELPGGTLEPGEHYLATLQRELLEEAGARLITFEIIGAWRCHSSAPKPYRPHLPHPDFYRLVGYGKIELVSRPYNPVDGEQIVTVERLSLEEARQRFLSSNRPDLAELYQLAAMAREMRQ